MSFQHVQDVLFRHCDPAGIVFYPRYFEMINDTVEAFFGAELDMPFSELHKEGGVPTVEITTKFSAPSRIGDRLVVTLDVTHAGRTSVGITLVARCADEVRFTANAALVLVDTDTRPRPWPEHAKQHLIRHCKDGSDET